MMRDIVRTTAAIGLLFPLGVQAQQTNHDVQRPPIELCEAFSWDAPPEQSLTVESVVRWRHGTGISAAAERHSPLARPVVDKSLSLPIDTTLYGQAAQARRTTDRGTDTSRRID